MSKLYLLDDIEVVLTGRVAKRQLKNEKIDEKHEIRPKSSEVGSWKKWVRLSDLYEIKEEEENGK